MDGWGEKMLATVSTVAEAVASRPRPGQRRLHFKDAAWDPTSWPQQVSLLSSSAETQATSSLMSQCFAVMHTFIMPIVM